jgi:hypothetical protein
MLDPQQRCFGLTPASKNGSRRQTCLGSGVATRDAQAAVARDGLRLRSPRRHRAPVRPAKEKDEYIRQELQTAAVSQRVRAAPLASRNIWTIPKSKIAIHNDVEC